SLMSLREKQMSASQPLVFPSACFTHMPVLRTPCLLPADACSLMSLREKQMSASQPLVFL
ncbi:MAG: hypothetical protein Q4E29_14345, partial [Lachnospiraceae bacterium]|nr:hypothetical protein [Lachnospiraceae bacterium]